MQVRKVIIYVTRASGGGTELLVFDHRDHPEAGVQVPAGTVEAGETFAAAAARELCEESGLCGLTPSGPIDQYDWPNPATGKLHTRQVFHVEARGLPDRWEHAVHGRGDDAGLAFCYRWIPLADAINGLAGDQGRSVRCIPAAGAEPART
jgi:8-oxo-dGTP pyrophosphatase MutT (NUDIX family)